MADRVPAGAFQVLWLGDPRAVNQGSWSAGDGLAYATSVNGTPDAVDLWAPAGSGPTSTVAQAVTTEWLGPLKP